MITSPVKYSIPLKFNHNTLLGACSLCLVCLTGLGQAQFSSGINLGFATTQLNGDGTSGFNKAGLVGGYFVKFTKPGTLNYRLELNYVGKGSRTPADVSSGNFVKQGFTFHYLELPVLAEVEMSRFHVHFGPYAGILLWGKQMFDGEHFEVINPPLRPIEFGAMAGIGVLITDQLEVFARYSQSMLPIRAVEDPANLARWWDFAWSNMTVMAGVSYSFD